MGASLLTIGTHIVSPTDPAAMIAQGVERAAEAVRPDRSVTPKTGKIPSLKAWLPAVTPAYRWDWPHIEYVREHLDRITAGTLKKLIIELPPRHGKSELVTVRYPAYRLERTPSLRVIIGAYNDTLARKFSRRARRITGLRIALSDDRTAAEEWETSEGGGVRAVGVGGGITGQGGDVIIIDDPVKSREEAESLTFRDRVWEWYTDDIYTRREPGAAIIVMMTRWHEDDLAGRILASDDGPNWTVIRLPALAEPNDPLGREEGEALCPDRYDEDALAEIRVVLGAYSFDALYQQNPTARKGQLFDPAWFGFVDAAPAEATRARAWDFGATDGDGDPTAGVRMSRSGGIYYVEHVERGQWAPGARDQHIRSTAETDGKAVMQIGEQEPGSAGKTAALAFIQNLAGFRVHTFRPTGNKAVRADPFASQAQAGNVKIVRGPWNTAYLEELRQFPRGPHDDQVDGSSAAFAFLSRHKPVNVDPGSYKRATIHA